MRALSLVVPMYNEAERFTEAWPQLSRWIAAQPAGSELVLVDDGSTDATAAVAARALAACPHVPARLLRTSHAGKGAAVRAGLLAAQAPLAAFCDVDLATPLVDLERIVRTADAQQCLAIASRAHHGSRVVRRQHPVRETLGRLFNKVVQLALVSGVSDTQCGAKAAPASVWRALLAHSDEVGFAWDCEIVAIARRMSVAVCEVPITWRHDPRSRMRVVRDGPAMILAVPRIARRVSRLGARA